MTKIIMTWFIYYVLTTASSSVLARLDGAVVDPVLAPLAGEAGLADAVVVVDGVHALSVVGAGRVHAVVDVELAKLSCPAGRAQAPVGEKQLIN